VDQGAGGDARPVGIQESRVAAYRQGELPRDGAPRQETLDAVVVRLVAECAPDDAGALSMVDRRQAPTWEGLRLFVVLVILSSFR